MKKQQFNHEKWKQGGARSVFRSTSKPMLKIVLTAVNIWSMCTQHVSNESQKWPKYNKYVRATRAGFFSSSSSFPFFFLWNTTFFLLHPYVLLLSIRWNVKRLLCFFYSYSAMHSSIVVVILLSFSFASVSVLSAVMDSLKCTFSSYTVCTIPLNGCIYYAVCFWICCILLEQL